MNGSLNWLDAWKTQAQNRQQWLARALAKPPAGPWAASLRERYVQRAQHTASVQKDWAEAYLAHVKSVSDLLIKRSAKPSQSSSGSFGDAG